MTCIEWFNPGKRLYVAYISDYIALPGIITYEKNNHSSRRRSIQGMRTTSYSWRWTGNRWMVYTGGQEVWTWRYSRRCAKAQKWEPGKQQGGCH